MKISLNILLVLLISLFRDCGESKMSESSDPKSCFQDTGDKPQILLSNVHYEEFGGIKIYLMGKDGKSALDSITVLNAAEISDTSALFYNVWRIRFRVNGGTGVSIHRTMVLTACNNQLNISLDVNSDLISSEEDKYSQSGYEDSPRKVRIEDLSYFKFYYDDKLGKPLKIERKLSKLINGRVDTVNIFETELYFDNNKNVFFNNYTLLNGVYKLVKGKELQEVEIFDMLVPIITYFDNSKYYYYNGHWYMESNKNNTLLEMY